MFSFTEPRPRRKPSLTPMIDVVFLLLVFFMLAARFGQDMALPLTTGAGGDTQWEGGPRLVEVRAETILLNGQAVDLTGLAGTLAPLMPKTDSPVLMRAGPDTDLARFVSVIDTLRAAGLARLVVVE